jgi:formate--tetrahydrofolate ligase
MATLLKDSLSPNLVQTIEGSPAFIHGGPFANIAHGCNSVIATKAALSLSDIVVTEAGFGADLGAEKFFNIKCRKSGLKPNLAVVVATVRALKYHGGVERASLGEENLEALECGFANLKRHLENIGKFNVPAIVALNAFDSDTDNEKRKVIELCESIGVRCLLSTHWADGAAGAEALAKVVVEELEANPESQFSTLYPDSDSPEGKLRTVAREIYRADDIELSKAAKRKLARLEGTEAARFPVCIAKTPYSFSSDPLALGAATGFSLPIRDIKVSAGAGFVIALSGDIMTMPGLPRNPAGEVIDVDGEGKITGLS